MIRRCLSPWPIYLLIPLATCSLAPYGGRLSLMPWPVDLTSLWRNSDLCTFAIICTRGGMTWKRTTERTLLCLNSVGSILICLIACFCYMHCWVFIPINAFGGFLWLFVFGLRPRSCGCVFLLCWCLVFLRGWIRISDRGICTSSLRKVYGFDYVPPLICTVWSEITIISVSVFPESVWAQGSSNSGGLYLIFSSSHLLIFTSSLTPSHLHIFSHTFSSSHLLIFTSSLTPSHLQFFSHTFSSSHLLIFTSSLTPSHLHIFSHTFSSSHLLSHLLIFTSSLTPSHLHIFSHTFSSSHLLSHLLIFTSSLTPSHLHIFSHTFSSSHLLIFTSSLTPSHLHIFSHTFSSSHLLSHLLIFTPSLTPSHLHIFSLSHSLSFLSPFSLSRLLYLSLFRPRVVPAVSHETSTLSHEMRVDRQELRKNCEFTCPGATLSHEMRVDRQKLR